MGELLLLMMVIASLFVIVVAFAWLVLPFVIWTKLDEIIRRLV